MPEGKDGKQYYFPDDLTDKADRVAPRASARRTADKPWLMYYSTGCEPCAAPRRRGVGRQVQGQVRRRAGTRYREEIFARQKELGVIPPDAELTPRNDAFPAWDSLPDDAKRLYARQMEVYAGFGENADWNVGRLLDAIDEMGELDNTLVIYIWGDNGASMEGTITGSFNEMTIQNGIPLTPEQQLGAHRAVRRPRRLGRPTSRAALRGRVGMGRQHAVPVGQADRQPPRRHA